MLTLNRCRLFVLAFALIGVGSAMCLAQTPYTGPLPVFDVVTVKPHKPGDTNTNVSRSPTSLQATNISLEEMIAGNYNVKAWLIFGLPPWAESQKWDIVAKVSEPDPAVMKNLSREQRNDMVKALLKERFGLQLHMDSKVQPVFEMTAVPEGVKFKESPPPPKNEDGTPGKNPGASSSSSDSHMVMHHAPLRSFAENLSYRVERTVVDKTGMHSENGYDIELTWTPEMLNNGGDNGSGQEAPPPIFEAVKEQLGLKLTPTKAEVPTIVIDHVQMPDAN